MYCSFTLFYTCVFPFYTMPPHTIHTLHFVFYIFTHPHVIWLIILQVGSLLSSLQIHLILSPHSHIFLSHTCLFFSPLFSARTWDHLCAPFLTSSHLSLYSSPLTAHSFIVTSLAMKEAAGQGLAWRKLWGSGLGHLPVYGTATRCTCTSDQHIQLVGCVAFLCMPRLAADVGL